MRGLRPRSNLIRLQLNAGVRPPQRIYRMRALLFALVIATVPACGRRSPAPPPSPDTVVGLYETGFEPRGFRLCDPAVDGLWRPVQLPAKVDPSRWPGTPTGMSAVMHYVRWRGRLAEPVPGGTGRPLALIVSEVLEVRAARRGDCSWRPN